jgi:hypothetical protein
MFTGSWDNSLFFMAVVINDVKEHGFTYVILLKRPLTILGWFTPKRCQNGDFDV